MKLICLQCGNFIYFETEIEAIKELTVNEGKLIVEDAKFPDFNYTEDSIRCNLKDIVDFVLKQNALGLVFDPETESYYNQHITCARCGSPKVSKPFKPKPRIIPLDQELEENREEYYSLRKERDHENNLPVLWQP